VLGRSSRLPIWALLGLNAALGPNRVFSAITVLSIAASVALATSLELSSRAVQRLADHTADALAGAAQLEVVAGRVGMPERLVAELRAIRGVAAASPLLQASLSLEAAHIPLWVLGVDLLEERPPRALDVRGRGIEVPDPLKLLARADAVILSEGVARKTGVSFDESLAVRTPRGPRTLHVEGLLADRGLARAFGGQVAVMDLYALQALVGREELVDRIDVVPAEGADVAALQDEIVRRVAGQATVRRTGMRLSSLDQAVSALRAVLLTVASIGAVVAGLLSYAAMSTAVERRLHELAVLRSTGFSALDVARFIALDSLAFSALGTGLGFAAGCGLARVFLPTVAQVSQYFSSGSPPEAEVRVSLATVGLALATGVFTTLCGAIGPARIATRRYVLDAAREDPGGAAGLRGPKLAIWALAWALALGWFALTPGMAPRVRLLGELAAGAALAASLVPAALSGVARVREPLSGLVAGIGHLVGTGLAVRPRGTALAVAAIAALVGFEAALINMAASFRETLMTVARSRYPDAILVSSVPPWDAVGNQGVLPEVVAAIRRTPGVRDVSEAADASVLVRGEEVTFFGYDSRVSFAHRDPVERARYSPVFAALARGELAVSYAFAHHFRIGTGDTLELSTPRGPQRFRIGGELPGMDGPSGIIFADLATFDHWFPRVSADSLRLWTAGDPESVIEAIREATHERQSLFFTSSRELEAGAEEFAHRFDALLFGVATLALVLGGVAIANLLLGVVAARRRELVLLRTAGASPNQLAALVLSDAVLIAAGSLGAGLALGCLASAPMLEVMGDEFGLIADPHLDAPRWAVLAGLVFAALLLSALYPALLARRTQTLEVTSFG
jgi:putative ABC transport system permease protein